MIGWWILGILLLVILLLCLTRVGVLIRFGEELTVSARFGFLKFQVLPEKKKPPKNEKKPEEAQKKQTQKQEKPKKAFPKPTLSDIRDAWKALWPPLKKALRRTRRGVRIDPLDEVKNEDYWNARWRILEEIKLKLDENEIEMAYPHLTVQMGKEN